MPAVLTRMMRILSNFVEIREDSRRVEKTERGGPNRFDEIRRAYKDTERSENWKRENIFLCVFHRFLCER